MNIVDVLSKFDPGEMKCRFLECISSLIHDVHPRDNGTILRTLLAFHEQCQDLVAEFAALRLGLERISPERIDEITKKSIVDIVFFSNAFEYAGAPTVADTERIIRSMSVDVGPQKEQEVTRLYELISDTFQASAMNHKNPAIVLGFDSVKLKGWHRKMLPESSNPLVASGEFRQIGVKSSNLDGSVHTFPHHEIVNNAINELCRICYLMLEGLGGVLDDGNRPLAFTFALAAFVQFHFVDIHPFADGNGRMGRFLSKRILDFQCRVPFPVATDREAYLKAIELCRKCTNPCDAPVELMKVIVKSGIDHYRSLLAVQYVKFICVKDESELREHTVIKSCSEKDKDTIVSVFDGIASGDIEPKDIELSDGRKVRILKFPTLIIDNIDAI